jgi:hypothetical protein
MLAIDSGGTNAQMYGWRTEKPEVVILSSAETIRIHVQCQAMVDASRASIEASFGIHYQLLYLLIDANG